MWLDTTPFTITSHMKGPTDCQRRPRAAACGPSRAPFSWSIKSESLAIDGDAMAVVAFICSVRAACRDRICDTRAACCSGRC